MPVRDAYPAFRDTQEAAQIRHVPAGSRIDASCFDRSHSDKGSSHQGAREGAGNSGASLLMAPSKSP